MKVILAIFFLLSSKFLGFPSLSEIRGRIYSLKNNIPVPFEWAAKKDDKWTLHYSLIYGIDVKNDLIYILNPLYHVLNF